MEWDWKRAGDCFIEYDRCGCIGKYKVSTGVNSSFAFSRDSAALTVHVD